MSNGWRQTVSSWGARSSVKRHLNLLSTVHWKTKLDGAKLRFSQTLIEKSREQAETHAPNPGNVPSVWRLEPTCAGFLSNTSIQGLVYESLLCILKSRNQVVMFKSALLLCLDTMEQLPQRNSMNLLENYEYSGMYIFVCYTTKNILILWNIIQWCFWNV